ncbi:transposable element Tcb2 transposase [Trichonephila clavipes]|nr:transposable element Tcb2 transposase [Trichonephila clavipes]
MGHGGLFVNPVPKNIQRIYILFECAESFTKEELRRVARQLGRSDCFVRRCWDQWIREVHLHEDQAQVALNRPVTEKTATSDETRFNLSSDGNRVRVKRPRGECINPAFALQRHTAPTAGVRTWSVIDYNTRSPLVLIRGTMTAQRHIHDILQPHILPLIETIFQQDNTRPHPARVSQDRLLAITTLPWPARSPDSSPIEHIWDHLGR